MTTNDDPLTHVNAHLRDLADRVLGCGADLAAIRGLIEEFAAVDPSTSIVRTAAQPVMADGVPCEWLLPEAADPGRRLAYIHGGSWMSGSLPGYRAHAARVAEATGCAVLNIDYRLAPEHAFPAGLDDCNRAFDWMLANGPRGAQPAHQAFLAGDSAGGNLVLALSLKRRDANLRPADAVVSLSPATDLTWSSPSITGRAERDPILRPARLNAVVAGYLQGQAEVTDPYVSPLFGDLTDLPPLLLQLGDAEVLHDDATRFAERARAAGVRVELDITAGAPHVFQAFAPYLPQASAALSRIGAFLATV